jgi:hypothetical protein
MVVLIMVWSPLILLDNLFARTFENPEQRSKEKNNFGIAKRNFLNLPTEALQINDT